MTTKIVGAGFSGLTAAYYLQKVGHPVEIYEAGPSPGGLISTKQKVFGIVETAANAVLNSSLVEEMAEELKLDFLRPLPSARNRYILRRGLRRWPLNSKETVRLLWGALSTRLGGNPIFQARPKESVAAWANRVFGIATNHYFLEPALQGIYGAGTDELSGNLILNSFAAARRALAHSGNVEGVRRKPRFHGSTAPEKGMGTWIQALVEHIQRRGACLHFERRITNEELSTWVQGEQRIVVATDLAGASVVLEGFAPEIAKRMRQIPSISLVSVTAFFPRTKGLPQGFGCLFPKAERMHALGVLWNSTIFAGRLVPEKQKDLVSETWIFGGKTRGESGEIENKRIHEILQASDSQLKAWIEADRKKIVRTDAEALALDVNRWPGALPCYGVELEEWLAGDDPKWLEKRGIILHGNYLGRLGLSGILARSAELPARFV